MCTCECKCKYLHNTKKSNFLLNISIVVISEFIIFVFAYKSINVSTNDNNFGIDRYNRALTLVWRSFAMNDYTV